MFLLLFAGVFIPQAAFATALDDYVNALDGHFTINSTQTIVNNPPTTVTIRMRITSQWWRSAADVNSYAWRHWLQIVVPNGTPYDNTRAMLIVNGGSNTAGPSDISEYAVIALAAGSAVGFLEGVPNEPVRFTDESFSRTEDEIIAYTYNKYMLNYPDNPSDPTWRTWPLLSPMVKSTVRAMDVIQSVLNAAPYNRNIQQFVIGGASKRGWTTWLTAAYDAGLPTHRVIGIVPMVIDVLHMDQQMQHHFNAYQDYPPESALYHMHGGYSDAISDYVDMNVFQRLGTPEGDSLLGVVDPYRYLSRATMNMPKLIINSTGDQFFLPDGIRRYWNDLPGAGNRIYYAPNTDHSLSGPGGIDFNVPLTTLAFYQAILAGAQLPRFNWTVQPDLSMHVTTTDAPTEVRLYQAHNPDHRDFRLENVGPIWTSSILDDEGGGTYTVQVDPPNGGWTGFYAQLTFPGLPGPYGAPFVFTTQLNVIPDTYPPILSGLAPNRGSTNGGTVVTLSGDHFYSACVPCSGSLGVTFDGVGATNVTWVDIDTIVCTAPPHAAGPVDVVVTNPDSNAVTSAGAFTYDPLAMPAVPDNPGATDIGTDRITWTWRDNSSDESGFKVHDDPGAGPPVTLRTTTPQDAQAWEHTGLEPNAQYAFQVAATNADGDSAKTDNYSEWTSIEAVSGLLFSEIGLDVITVVSANTPTNLTSGSSGLWLANTTLGTDSGWQIVRTPWTSDGLAPNTEYVFEGKSRNGAGRETAPSMVAMRTLIEPVAGLLFSDVAPDSITVVSANTPSNLASANSGLWLGNMTTGTDSGWQSSNVSWISNGLAANTEYVFSGKSRNGAGQETAPATMPQWTLIEPVAGLLFSDVSTDSITVVFANTFTNLTSGGSGLWLGNTTLGTDSGWQQDTNPWPSTGLTPNTPYMFFGKARNSEGVETEPVVLEKWTLAATPAAPVVSDPAAHSLSVSIGSGDGNPPDTAYAMQISPEISGNAWVQADGSVGAGAVYRTAAAWGAISVVGLEEYAAYAFVATARNGEAISAGPGPPAAGRTLDVTPPTGTVSIGAAYTNTTAVVLTLSASDGSGSGVADMQFSNDASTWSGWEAYATGKAWTLDSGDGAKTVHVRYRDTAGNGSTDAINAGIILDTLPPTAAITLHDPTPTSADSVAFTVVFSETLATPLAGSEVSPASGSLAGAIAVTGADPSYTVTVTPSDPDADGAVGIAISGAGITDLAGNPYAGGVSASYAIHNWHGLTTEPSDARLYPGGSHTFGVDGDFGPITPTFQWKWDDGGKTIQNGPTTSTWLIAIASPANRGTYWCEVTYDGTMHESARANLSVEDHLVIAQQPQGADKIAGESHAFVVTTTGGYQPLAFQWKKDGVDIQGRTNDLYELPLLDTADSGVYSVEIRDGNTDVCVSEPAVLNVTCCGIPAVGLAGMVILSVLIATGGVSRMRKR